MNNTFVMSADRVRERGGKILAGPPPLYDFHPPKGTENDDALSEATALRSTLFKT
jgi:hypothetical protein